MLDGSLPNLLMAYTTFTPVYFTFSYCTDLQRIPRRGREGPASQNSLFSCQFLKNSDFYRPDPDPDRN